MGGPGLLGSEKGLELPGLAVYVIYFEGQNDHFSSLYSVWRNPKRVKTVNMSSVPLVPSKNSYYLLYLRYIV